MPNPPRPRPDDFDAMRATMTIIQLRKHYRAGQPTVMGWLDPQDRRRSQTVPDDFAANCAVMSYGELARHYGKCSRTLTRWIRESGIKPIRKPRSLDRPGPKLRAIPADFAEVAKGMARDELRTYYKCGDRALSRWIAESGVKTRGNAPVKWTGVVHGARRSYGNLTITRAYTCHDEAADILRRERFVVYRAADKGRADPKGKLWRVGNVVCSPDELLARADRYRRQAA